jgi:site-specific recombinase XerD
MRRAVEAAAVPCVSPVGDPALRLRVAVEEADGRPLTATAVWLRLYAAGLTAQEMEGMPWASVLADDRAILVDDGPDFRVVPMDAGLAAAVERYRGRVTEQLGSRSRAI